jgi:hypothetical protein
MYEFSPEAMDVRTVGGGGGLPGHVGDGRPDKWAEGTKGGGGGHVTRCGGRARVVLCINSKLAIGWLLFFVYCLFQGKKPV